MRGVFGRASILLVAACSVAVAAPVRPAEVPLELQKALQRATLTAVDQETESYRGKLKTAEGGTGPKENVERFKERLVELDAERRKVSGMRPEEYPLPTGTEPDAIPLLDPSTPYGPLLPPAKRTVSVTVDAPYGVGSLLSVDGMSRSGPFYHLAGITGGDYRVLRPGKRYTLTVYLVYRREYFGSIGDYHVYVAELR